MMSESKMSTSEASTSKRPVRKRKQLYDVSAVLAMRDDSSDAASGSDLDMDDFGVSDGDLSSESNNEVLIQLQTSPTKSKTSKPLSAHCHGRNCQWRKEEKSVKGEDCTINNVGDSCRLSGRSATTRLTVHWQRRTNARRAWRCSVRDLLRSLLSARRWWAIHLGFACPREKQVQLTKAKQL